MATTLIVLAHPHRRSFAGDWADATARASAAAGHDVLWSDLSDGQFDPQEGAQHFDPDLSAGGFDPLKVHEAAVAAVALVGFQHGVSQRIGSSLRQSSLRTRRTCSTMVA